MVKYAFNDLPVASKKILNLNGIPSRGYLTH